MVSQRGVVTCNDFKTGEQLWQGRIEGDYSASAIFADGRIHFFNEDGQATIIQPGDRLEVLAVNQLDDGFMASPAVAGDSLFLRTKTHLYRVAR